eukprot:scaffold320106_cov23-Tisochrysis_lutea.AAC.1
MHTHRQTHTHLYTHTRAHTLKTLHRPCCCTGSAASPEGPVFGPPQGAFDLKSVREVVHACERGVVLMIDREMAVINRAWCLFEVRECCWGVRRALIDKGMAVIGRA